MIPKKNRLKRSSVKYTLKKGQKVSSEFFIIKYLKAKSPENRFSVSVSLKTAPKAVDRNKLRRKIYSIIKKLDLDFPSKLNMVIIVKKSAAELTYEALNEKIKDIIKKIHG